MNDLRRPQAKAGHASTRRVWQWPPLATAFAHLGRYLASHQIRTLLLCSIVMCSLFFPALSLYFSPDGPASAVARRGRGFMVWELEGIQRQGMIWSEDEVCWHKLAGYYESSGRGHSARVVRMEQVLISSSKSSFGGALNKQTLHQTLQVQHELQRRLLANDIPGLTCIRSAPDRCAVSSPTNFWPDEQALLDDDDVHRTLSLPSHPDDSAVPLTLTNTLVGVGRDRRGTVKGAHYMAISFYLEDTSVDLVLSGRSTTREDTVRDAAKAAWRRTVREVVSGKGWDQPSEQMGKVGEGRGQGRKIMLKHLPFLPVHDNPRLLEDVIFCIAYLIVGIYAVRTLKSLHQVHWKVGLVFTGIVELVASGIMSLSICWLMGFSVTLVPWKLIPFLVLVCGVDNMFVLTNAIHNTDISLPVPARVAAGLSSVGVYATVTLAIELALSSFLLSVVAVQVIRELIVFATVALIVDYCMEMTFFTTILSIDIQRMELADLLSSGSMSRKPPLSPAIAKSPLAPLSAESSKPSPAWTYVKEILQARAARTATFATLLIINTLLYSTYGPDHYLPAFCSETALARDRPLLGPSLAAEFATSLNRGRRGDSLTSGEGIRTNAAADFWQMINPGNTSSVHVYIEPVTVIKFYEDELAAPESAADTIVDTPTYVKIALILAPIATVTLVLYGILLYLLKDAKLLEKESEDNIKAAAERKRDTGREAGMEMVSLRGRYVADVELLASSRDVVVSWAGLDDQIVIWRRTRAGPEFDSQTRLDIPITADPASLVHLAVDVDSRFVAAATDAGRLLVWDLERRLAIDFSTPNSPSSTASHGAVIHLFAAPVPVKDTKAPPGASTLPSLYGFYSIHRTSGSILFWDCTTCRSSVVLALRPAPPSIGSNKTKTFLVPASDAVFGWPVYARADPAGTLELYRCGTGLASDDWQRVFDSAVTSASDPVTSLAFGTFDVGRASPTPRQCLVVGTSCGLVLLFDLESGARIMTLSDLDGPVRQIRLAPPSPAKCAHCGEALLDGFAVVVSTRETVRLLRTFTSASAACQCTSVVVPGVALSAAGRTTSGSLRAPSKRRVSGPMLGPSEHSGSSLDRRRSDDRGESSLRVESPSRPGLDIPVDDSTGDVSIIDLQASEAGSTTDWHALRTQTEGTVPTDERGGWELLGDTVVGLRRSTPPTRALSRREGETRGRFWEVWSIALGGEANLEGTTCLEPFLRDAVDRSLVPTTLDTPEPLRRRNVSTRGGLDSPSRRPSLALPPRLELALPFSRARPIIPALSGALAIGLGNCIAVIRVDTRKGKL